MGYVCSAIDESIDEVVALKVLSLPIHEDPDAFERFKNELKLARRIRHRNVVQSFDLGFAEGYPFISMEYIDADNLLKHLTRRPNFDEHSALTIMRQVLRGLRAAHDLGIVHRDIKPENILLNKDRMAFITDFGIATSQDLVRKELAGTPDYMAPEQLRCEAGGAGVRPLLVRRRALSHADRRAAVPRAVDQRSAEGASHRRAGTDRRIARHFRRPRASWSRRCWRRRWPTVRAARATCSTASTAC